MLKLLSVVVFVFAATSQAAPSRALLKVPANFASLPTSCHPVDYSAVMGPIRNQGATSWCFAYAAADLISQRVGGMVSAVDIATQYYLNDPADLARVADTAVRDFLRLYPEFERDVIWARQQSLANTSYRRFPGVSSADGGYEQIAALLANGRGLCAESKLPSANGYSGQMLKRLRHYVYTSLRNQRLTRDQAVLRANAEWMQAVDRACDRVKSPVPFVPVTGYWAANLDEYRRYMSQGRLYPQDAGRDLLGRLNYALNNGRVVSIGYDANLIADFGNDEEIAGHASVIVGRNMIGGQCHYLLRNSWGASCEGYRPGFKERCQAGHLWISEAELIKATYSVTFLR